VHASGAAVVPTGQAGGGGGGTAPTLSGVLAVVITIWLLPSVAINANVVVPGGAMTAYPFCPLTTAVATAERLPLNEPVYVAPFASCANSAPSASTLKLQAILLQYAPLQLPTNVVPGCPGVNRVMVRIGCNTKSVALKSFAQLIASGQPGFSGGSGQLSGTGVDV